VKTTQADRQYEWEQEIGRVFLAHGKARTTYIIEYRMVSPLAAAEGTTKQLASHWLWKTADGTPCAPILDSGEEIGAWTANAEQQTMDVWLIDNEIPQEEHCDCSQPGARRAV
jgi:hypothetical protein